MKFGEQHFETKATPRVGYVVRGADYREITLKRDDVLVEAAAILIDNPQFPDSRGDRANHLRAKRAIRDALIKFGSGNYFNDELESQIGEDAYEVLNLVKEK